MTKEEARLTLQENFGYLSDEHPRIIEAMKVAMNILSQPSLPSDLDEVAKKQAETIYPKNIRTGHVAEHDVNLLTRRGFKKGFKAGVEWLAGQGYGQD